MPIVISIDLRKVDQSKCKSHANGAKYCELVLLPREDNFGNHFMVVQGVSQEDRQNNIRGAILGNAKDTDRREPQRQQPQQRSSGGYSTPTGQARTQRPGTQRQPDPDLDGEDQSF